MISAAVIATGTHAGLTWLVSATSPVEAIVPSVSAVPIQARVIPTEHAYSERKVIESPEKVLTPAIMMETQDGGEPVSPLVPVTSDSNLTHELNRSHVSALPTPWHLFEMNVRHTTPSATLGAEVISPEELDVQPVLIDPVTPDYPAEESSASAGGLIKLQLVIDEMGQVTSVDVIESMLPPAFGVSARRAFEIARFKPGLRNGSPVKCRVVSSIQFAPSAHARVATMRPDSQPGLRE